MLLEEMIINEIKWRLRENKIIKNQIILGRKNKVVDRIPLSSTSYEAVPERILQFRLKEVIHSVQHVGTFFEKIFIVFYTSFDDPHLTGYKVFIIEKRKVQIFEILPMEEDSEIIQVFSCGPLRKNQKDDFLKTLQKIQKLIP